MLAFAVVPFLRSSSNLVVCHAQELDLRRSAVLALATVLAAERTFARTG